jgi:cytochrome-b5 reductase
MLRLSSRLKGCILAGGPAAAAVAYFGSRTHAESQAAPVGLDPGKWVPLRLIQKTPISDNTAIYKFAFADSEATSGMTVASCLVTKAAIGSEKPDGTRANVIRPYTPLSRPGQKGSLDLAVKVYQQGKMSRHIADLKIGDTLDFKGPILKTAYVPNKYESIGMVAGGTGIAPMLQVVDEVLSNPADRTRISLVFGNMSEADILLKESIEARVAAHPDQFSVYYVVDKAKSPSWTGGVGYVTKQMLTERLPAPSERSIVYVCGPPPMYKAVCGAKGTKEDPKAQGELGGLLLDMGFSSSNVFKF